jgi:hypothetical protein
MLQQINKAAKELYEGRDLVNVDREQLFALEGDDMLVSLPYYVEEIRGVRSHDRRERLVLGDMRGRYKSDGWAEPLLKWRERWKNPLKAAITNEAPFTLSIPQAETAAFTIILSGSTPNSARITESIIFAAGETSKVTANQFTEVFSFSNLSSHTYDVTLTDADGVELSVLPNVADRARYITVQVLDAIAVSLEQPYLVEVLYKNAFLFMRGDYDEFVCPGYDDAIAWQTIGNSLAKSRPDQAALAFQKVKMILGDRERNQMQSKDKTISFEGDGIGYPFGMKNSYGFGSAGAPSNGLFPGANRP